MTRIVVPHPRYHGSFLAAADEFVAAGEIAYAHIPALRPESFVEEVCYTREELDAPDVFARFTAWLARQSEPDAPRPEGYVAMTERWIVAGEEYVGRITLRHELNEVLRTWGGHVGYSVRPSARGRGHAGRALGMVLPLARDLGIDPVLITCDPDNEASRRTIERHGGVYEDTREGKLRYWVPSSEASSRTS